MRKPINPENVTTETIAKDGERSITTRIALLDTVESTDRGDETACVEITTYVSEQYLRQTVHRVLVRGGIVSHSISIGGDVDVSPLATRGQVMPRFNRRLMNELHEYYVADALAPNIFERLLTWASFVRPRYVVHFERGDYKTIARSTNSFEEANRSLDRLTRESPDAEVTLVDTMAVNA